MREEKVPVAPEEAGERVDKFLARKLDGLTRSAVQKLLEKGCVTRDGKALEKQEKTVPGAALCVQIPDAVPLELQPEPVPLDIVYEDGDLRVVNKPKGMVVHPAAGNPSGTLVNAPGISEVYKEGYITYSNEAKIKLLGV